MADSEAPMIFLRAADSDASSQDGGLSVVSLAAAVVRCVSDRQTHCAGHIDGNSGRQWTMTIPGSKAMSGAAREVIHESRAYRAYVSNRRVNRERRRQCRASDRSANGARQQRYLSDESARYVTQCQILRAKGAFSSLTKLHLVAGVKR